MEKDTQGCQTHSVSSTLTLGLDWKLINNEPPEVDYSFVFPVDSCNQMQSESFKLKAINEECYRNDNTEEVFINNTLSFDKDTYHQQEAVSEEDSNAPPIEPQDYSKFENGETGSIGSFLEVDWQLINVETSDLDEFVHSQKERIQDYDLDYDEPGPSSGKRYSSYAAASSSKSQTEIEDISSASQQESSAHSSGENNLSGLSKVKKNSILKKPSESRHACDIVDWKLINFEESDCELPEMIYSPASVLEGFQTLNPKQPGTETKKHVHFDPRSECNLFDFCGEELLIRNSFPVHKDTAVIHETKASIIEKSYSENLRPHMLELTNGMLQSNSYSESFQEKCQTATEANKNCSANTDSKESNSSIPTTSTESSFLPAARSCQGVKEVSSSGSAHTELPSSAWPELSHNTNTADHEESKQNFLGAGKRTVEAMLIILQCMQIVLLHMAKMTVPSHVDDHEKHASDNSNVLTNCLKQKGKNSSHMFCGLKPIIGGLLICNIAQQNVKQAFKKIDGLYPEYCSKRMLADPVVESKDSLNTTLALIAMKDALRDFQDSGSKQSYTSAVVLSSDSSFVNSFSEDNILGAEHFNEKASESQEVTSNSIDQLFTSAKLETNTPEEDGIHDVNSESLLADIRFTNIDKLQTELEQTCAELLLRTIKKAISVKTLNDKATITCASKSFQSFPVPPLETEVSRLKFKDLERNEDDFFIIDSKERAEQKENKPFAAFFEQNISDAINGLILELFSHLQSVDFSREELEDVLAGEKAGPADKAGCALARSSISENRFSLPESLTNRSNGTFDLCAEAEMTAMTLNILEQTRNISTAEDSYLNASRSNQELIKNYSQDTNEKPEAAECLPSASKYGFKSLQMETSAQSNNRAESFSTEELCDVSDSTQLVSSITHTLNGISEHQPNLQQPGSFSHPDSCRNPLHLIASLPSLEDSEHSMELASFEESADYMFSFTGFGNFPLSRSSIFLLDLPIRLNITGGNHAEHVQVTEWNHPSCSGKAEKENHVPKQQEPRKTVTSKSVTAAMTGRKEHNWLNCCGPLHHQPHRTKLVSNTPKHKHSLSEPKLDFYRRTEEVKYPRIMRQLFTCQADTSDWMIVGYYPPRSRVTTHENHHEEDGNVHTLEFDEGITVTEAEVILEIITASESVSEHSRTASGFLTGQSFQSNHPQTSTSTSASFNINQILKVENNERSDVSKGETQAHWNCIHSNIDGLEADIHKDGISKLSAAETHEIIELESTDNQAPNNTLGTASGLKADDFLNNYECPDRVKNSSLSQTILSSLGKAFDSFSDIWHTCDCSECCISSSVLQKESSCCLQSSDSEKKVSSSSLQHLTSKHSLGCCERHQSASENTNFCWTCAQGTSHVPLMHYWSDPTSAISLPANPSPCMQSTLPAIPTNRLHPAAVTALPSGCCWLSTQSMISEARNDHDDFSKQRIHSWKQRQHISSFLNGFSTSCNCKSTDSECSTESVQIMKPPTSSTNDSQNKNVNGTGNEAQKHDNSNRGRFPNSSGWLGTDVDKHQWAISQQQEHLKWNEKEEVKANLCLAGEEIGSARKLHAHKTIEHSYNHSCCSSVDTNLQSSVDCQHAAQNFKTDVTQSDQLDFSPCFFSNSKSSTDLMQDADAYLYTSNQQIVQSFPKISSKLIQQERSMDVNVKSFPFIAPGKVAMGRIDYIKDSFLLTSKSHSARVYAEKKSPAASLNKRTTLKSRKMHHSSFPDRVSLKDVDAKLRAVNLKLNSSHVLNTCQLGCDSQKVRPSSLQGTALAQMRQTISKFKKPVSQPEDKNSCCKTLQMIADKPTFAGSSINVPKLSLVAQNKSLVANYDEKVNTFHFSASQLPGNKACCSILKQMTKCSGERQSIFKKAMQHKNAFECTNWHNNIQTPEQDHKLSRDSIPDESTENDDLSFSEHSTIFMLAGQKDIYSAIFTESLTPQNQMNCAETAYQASDESICNAAMERSWNAELSLLEDFKAETQEKFGRCHGKFHSRCGAVASSPLMECMIGHNGFSPMTSTSDICSQQWGSLINTESPEYIMNFSPNLASSSSVLEGVFEVSHSRCSVCHRASNASLSLEGVLNHLHHQEKSLMPTEKKLDSFCSPIFCQCSLPSVARVPVTAASLSNGTNFCDPKYADIFIRTHEIEAIFEGGADSGINESHRFGHVSCAESCCDDKLAPPTQQNNALEDGICHCDEQTCCSFGIFDIWNMIFSKAFVYHSDTVDPISEGVNTTVDLGCGSSHVDPSYYCKHDVPGCKNIKTDRNWNIVDNASTSVDMNLGTML